MANVTAGQRYAALWQAAEDAQGIPRGLLAGLIDHETGGTWNPRAIRQEPAIGDASRGLTQILYRTAAGIGFDGGAEDLFDPAINIALGARYLAQQHNRAGTWEGALSAYNGGWRPDTGFGRPVTRPTTVVLARSQTTGAVTQTRTAMPGEYANQPYVDSVLERARAFGYAGNRVAPLQAGLGIIGILALLGALFARWRG